jgi:hypothetical protein
MASHCELQLDPIIGRVHQILLGPQISGNASPALSYFVGRHRRTDSSGTARSRLRRALSGLTETFAILAPDIAAGRAAPPIGDAVRVEIDDFLTGLSGARQAIDYEKPFLSVALLLPRPILLMLTPMVDTHLWRLRKKLGKYANQYIEASDVGYRFRPAAPPTG